MNDVLSDPLSMLEESFSLEIPCGGNSYPIARTCPNSAQAAWYNSHGIRCNNGMRNWKCLSCYVEWLQAVALGTGFARCACGLRRPAESWYVPL